MTENQIGALLRDLWRDLHDPDILWQAAMLAACVLLAWWLATLLRWRAPEESSVALKRSAAALRRVIFPLIAMVLLYSGRAALAPWHSVNLLSFAIPLFGALAGIRFAVYLLRLTFAQARWLDAFERAISTLIWGVLALHWTGILPEIVELLEQVRFSIGAQQFSLWSLIANGFWLAAMLMLVLWAGSWLEARLMRAEGLDTSTRAVLARFSKAALVVIGAIVLLPLLGVDLTLLSVFGGALGIGLGFGLQKIASNYLSGFIILLDRSIRLGDVITADGQHGVVTRITTRYVVVRALTGVEAIIPNDTLVTTTVLNHSYTDKKVRLAVRVQVAYGSDVPRAQALLVEAAGRHPRTLREPEPTAHLVNFADSGIDLELGFWIEDPENGTQNVRSDISVEILHALRAARIEIPFPQREVRLLRGDHAN